MKNVLARSPQDIEEASPAEIVSPQSISNYYLYDVVWGTTNWAAVGSGSLNEALILMSSDGAVWGKVSLGKSRQLLSLSKKGPGTLYGIAWNGSRFVVVGEKLLTSVDGSEWSVTAEFARCKLTRVTTNGSMFVAVGGYYGNGCVVTSPDGQAWTKQSSNSTRDLLQVAWNGTHFVAVGRGIIIRSADGMRWE